MLKEISKRCELCSEPASLYCPSDSAFLCFNCDFKVHSANFLVARHVRSSLCGLCGDFDGEQVSGAGNRRFGSKDCQSCGRSVNKEKEMEDNHIDDDDNSSLSSDCISTNESSTAGPATVKTSRDQDSCGEVSSVMRWKESRSRRSTVDEGVEGVLINWCKRIGLEGKQDDVVLTTAVQVLGVSSRILTFVPLRVALAASFWLALRFYGDTCHDLKRVEKITGVLAKMILAIQSKLDRALKKHGKLARHSDYEEGWAES